mgnify:CR=1 FL=1
MIRDNTHEAKHQTGDQGANNFDGNSEKAHYNFMSDVMNTATFDLGLNQYNTVVGGDLAHKAEKDGEKGQLSFTDAYFAIKGTNKQPDASLENEERKRAGSAAGGVLAFDQQDIYASNISQSAAQRMDEQFFGDMVNGNGKKKAA